MFGNDDPVTKATKEVAALEARLADFEKKRSETTQQRSALDGQRQELLTRIGDGDNDARKQLRSLDDRKQELSEDEQAFAANIARYTSALGDARRTLARAERQVAIDQAEEKIAALAALDRDLDGVLGQVHEKLNAFLAAAAAIGQSLAELDPTKFGSVGTAIQEQIRRGVWLKFMAMGKGVQASVDSFALARRDLELATATLRYRLAEQVTPGRGESLYRCRVAVPGLRNILDLGRGDLVALRPDEAEPFLEHDSIELVAA